MTDQPSAADRDAANRHRRRQYAAEAATYDRDADRSERWLLGSDHRQWAFSRAGGRILEVAIGAGLNLPHYPHDVHLTGIDLTPEMLTVARRRSSEAVGFTIEESDRLRAGVVERLVARKRDAQA